MDAEHDWIYNMIFSKLKNMHKNAYALIILALTASIMLNACGVRGSLKTPPPIWGDGVSAPNQSPPATPNTPNNPNSTP